MRILFDHQVFSWQTYGGISRYVVEQMRGLQALGQDVMLPQHFFSENVYLRQLAGFERKSLSRVAFKGKKWLQLQLGKSQSIRAIRAGRPAVFHPTYFDPYFLQTVQKHQVPWVLTVHDMIHELYDHGSKGFFSLDAKVKEHKRLLVSKAHAVIAVSDNTRKDLLRFCPEVDPGKIYVVHHGNHLTAQPAFKPEGGAPYLLFVGQRKGYKHFIWMLEQLVPVLKEYPELLLVCVGGGQFDETEQASITALGLESRVHYRLVQSDEALAGLYQGAFCFIFPSLYEGFGMPVLEAMACQCPVVLQQGSSLPEVGGDAALYFQANQPESLALAVRQLLDDEQLRQNMIKKGMERARMFTWEKSVQAHLDIYQSICA
ncbi:MAG TPA: glycosyltransferase family 1 protein [Saprospiraceae bacterium]|nr:glycosyltransferase family 1 protein [Saprospiraceae bacterium]